MRPASTPGYFEELTPEQFDRQLAASLIGPMHVTRPVLPVMRKQRSGHIISISSSAGLAATPRRSSASRHHDCEPGAAAAPLHRRCRCHCHRRAEDRRSEGEDRGAPGALDVPRVRRSARRAGDIDGDAGTDVRHGPARERRDADDVRWLRYRVEAVDAVTSARRCVRTVSDGPENLLKHRHLQTNTEEDSCG
jgi:hypothetical protein